MARTESEGPLSPKADDLLERVARVERNLTTGGSVKDQEDFLPKLAHLRSAIGEMTDLYEARLQEVKARNQQALDAVAQLADRVNRRDVRLEECVAPVSTSEAAKGEPKARENTGVAKTKDHAGASKANDAVISKTKESSGGSKGKDTSVAKAKENAGGAKATKRSGSKEAPGAKSKERRNSWPALPLGPGWLAQAVPVDPGTPADLSAVADAFAPWLRAAQAIAAQQGPPIFLMPPIAGSPAVWSATPYVPMPTPSPLWEQPSTIGVGSLLRRPGAPLSLVPY